MAWNSLSERGIRQRHLEEKLHDKICKMFHARIISFSIRREIFRSNGIMPASVSRGAREKASDVTLLQNADRLDREFRANSHSLGIEYVRVAVVFQELRRKSRMALTKSKSKSFQERFMLANISIGPVFRNQTKRCCKSEGRKRDPG
jgi:hypothetical protein